MHMWRSCTHPIRAWLRRHSRAILAPAPHSCMTINPCSCRGCSVSAPVSPPAPAPDLASHSRRVSSLDVDSTCVSSGENWTQRTQCAWPEKVHSFWPAAQARATSTAVHGGVSSGAGEERGGWL